MNSADEFRREIETLRQRSASLSAAILRISASLDVDTVLNEIAEAARALTGARYAVITAIDDAGQLEDFVMCGFTPQEERLIAEWPDNMQVFERLRGSPVPCPRGGHARLHPRTRLFHRRGDHQVLPGGHRCAMGTCRSATSFSVRSVVTAWEQSGGAATRSVRRCRRSERHERNAAGGSIQSRYRFGDGATGRGCSA